MGSRVSREFLDAYNTGIIDLTPAVQTLLKNAG